MTLARFIGRLLQCPDFSLGVRHSGKAGNCIDLESARCVVACKATRALSEAMKQQAAKSAYQSGDAEFSRKVHDPAEFAELLRTLPGHDEPKSLDGGVVKPMVFGGLDGIITTFAVVAGAIGADLTPSQVLIMGFCNLIADGFSMGFGEYTSSKAELEYAVGERDREAWELENYPEGEMKEMVEVYKSKGFSEEDACEVIPVLAKYKDFFVDHMLVEELGLLPPEVDEDPRKQGLVMFTAFVSFGSVPLLGFLILMAAWGKRGAADFKNSAFAVSCVLTAVTLLALGGFKAVYTKQNKVKSALMMLANGTVSGGAALLIGLVLNLALS